MLSDRFLREATDAPVPLDLRVPRLDLVPGDRLHETKVWLEVCVPRSTPTERRLVPRIGMRSSRWHRARQATAPSGKVPLQATRRRCLPTSAPRGPCGYGVLSATRSTFRTAATRTAWSSRSEANESVSLHSKGRWQSTTCQMHSPGRPTRAFPEAGAGVISAFLRAQSSTSPTSATPIARTGRRC